MLVGAHSIIYSRKPEADRAFLRDVLGFPHVDAGHGWLIFALPPAEVAVHPSEKNGAHELYLLCDDVEAFVEGMRRLGVACAPIQSLGWGLLTKITLPGGGAIGVYEPRHARPRPLRARGRASRSKPRNRGSKDRKSLPRDSRRREKR